MMLCDTKAQCLLADSRDKSIAGVEARSGYSFEDGQQRHYLRLNKVVSRSHAKKPRPEPRQDVLPGYTWAPGSEELDGYMSRDRQVWGTYIHLIFHNSAFWKGLFAA